MDTKEERYQQLKQALANVKDFEPTEKKINAGSIENAGAMDSTVFQSWGFADVQALPAFTSVDLSALTSADIDAWSVPNTAPFANSTVTLGGVGGSGAVYTISAGGGGGSGIVQAGNWAKPYTTTNAGRTTIDADEINVGGKSLMAALDRIEQRLGILDCDEQLELHWDKLKALGNEYRELKQHIEDKMKTFETLKTMPKPEIK
jgi:hypothetical protein